jgi:carbonic anhydrase
MGLARLRCSSFGLQTAQVTDEMQKLLAGVRRFQSDAFSTRRRLFEHLADGQHPMALFITCSDSRIDPNLLTQTEPGDLFVLRTAGNIVPPYDAAQAGEAGTIEYAVSVLKTPDVIVCGHSQCGAVTGVLNPESIREMSAVKSLLKHSEAIRNAVGETGPQSDGANRLAAAIEANVLLQLQHLQSHPSVAAALARNELRLHGWVYRFETGAVLAYDPDAERFVPLEDRPSENVGSPAPKA